MITITNLTKRYNNNIALDGVSCSIPDHSICALVGPNGAGKSTLLKILTQILDYDKGTIDYGTSLNTKRFRQSISYLPEQRGLYTGVDIETQLLYFASIRGISNRKAHENVNYWLKRIGIENWRHRLVSELSKGMQQKVQFASCLVSGPSVMFMDEPFSGVDPVNFRLFMEILQEYQMSTGATAILSTHNMKSVEELCSDVILLNKGNVEVSGNVSDVRMAFSKENVLAVELTVPDERTIENIHAKLHETFQVISSHSEQETLYLELTTAGATSRQATMVQALQLLRDFDIKCIARKVLSMEDIFIKLSKQ